MRRQLKTHHAAVGLCLTILLLAGCTAQTPATAPTANTPAFSAEEQLAIDTVAAQLDIDPADIAIVSSKAVEFNDASLNCPQPGMMYAQVITNGYQIVTSAQEREFDVRIAGSYAQICTNPGSTPRPRKTLTR